MILTLEEYLAKKSISTAEAFTYFDSLVPIENEFMFGRWKGAGFPTEHTLDGVLEATGWYGKEFRDEESVHPLMFYKANMKDLFVVNPALVTLSIPVPKSKVAHWLMLLIKPFIQTKKHKARLRMMRFRGKESATMVYDRKPINDVFRKIDEDTVLGLMDLKGDKNPFFFILRRASLSS